jgi:hypothetical protein
MSVFLLFSYALFFLLTWIEYSTFCFLFSVEEDPKRFAATAPIIDTPVIDEPPSQEVDLVVKSLKAPRAPIKKVVASRGSKHVKKSADVSASLETHWSTSSSDDVCVDTGIFAFVPCVILYSCTFSWTDLDEEVCHFGH